MLPNRFRSLNVQFVHFEVFNNLFYQFRVQKDKWPFFNSMFKTQVFHVYLQTVDKKLVQLNLPFIVLGELIDLKKLKIVLLILDFLTYLGSFTLDFRGKKLDYVFRYLNTHTEIY
jgi:hypothetical protein